jgi:hypothetical protein
MNPRKITCPMYEQGFPPYCAHPKAQNPDQPEFKTNIIFVCMGNEEYCIFRGKE